MDAGMQPAAAPPTPSGDPSMDTDPADADVAPPPPPPPPPPADDSEFEFEYELKRWRSIEDPKVHSPWQHFADYAWRLLIFPRGNSADTDISIYLECGGPREPPDESAATAGPTAGPGPGPGPGPGAGAAPAAAPAPAPLAAPAPANTNRNLDTSEKSKEPAPPPLVPAFWRRPARFVLSLKPTARTLPSSLELKKDTAHTFSEKEADWGFREFCRAATVLNDGYVDDAGSIHIHVQIKLEDAAADSMFNHGTWDSRKMTGYVGFKNQGATCYMNSLLQTLYMLGAFRRAVYRMPLPDAGDESAGGSRMSYALQKVFYELQHSDATVKTKKLTESFGWDNTDAFTQHDVQELNRILCDHLEERMKKIAPDRPNTVSQLFEGKILNYIECTNVSFKSTREESFYDLSLNVKGCRNLYESFDKYCEVETMDGDNKYRADGFDELQEARKGVRFLRLPPVLQLHLKRFEYDFNRDAMVKINDRFEYSTEIDLSGYVENSAPGTDVYVLHSVLVHIGDVNGGHYYVYIRPKAEKPSEEGDEQPQQPRQTAPPAQSTWYKFDDDMVSPASQESAVADNFGSGGERDDAPVNNNGDLNGTQTPPPSVYQQPRLRNYAARRLSNAYMLQYIRRDQAEQVLLPSQESDVPKALAKRIVSEQDEEERAKKARAEQHLYMNVIVANDRDMAEHAGVDAIAWEKVRGPIRVRRSMQLREFKVMLQDQNLVANWQHMRLWRCVVRQNESTRPQTLLANGMDDAPIAEPGRDLSGMAMYGMGYPRYNNAHLNDDVLKVYVEDFLSPYAFGAGGAFDAASARHREILSKGGDEAELRREAASLIPVNGFRLLESEVLLLLKRYVPTPTPRLEWAGHVVIDKRRPVRDLVPYLRKSTAARRELAPETAPPNGTSPPMVYEEFAADKVTLLDLDTSFERQDIPLADSCAGDIIVFMDGSAAQPRAAMDEDDRESVLMTPAAYDPELPLGGTRPLMNPPDYYRYLYWRCKVEFKDKYHREGNAAPGIVLELLLFDSYELARRILARALGDGADAQHLRFFIHDFHRDGPAPDAVRCLDDDEIRRILPTQALVVSSSEHRILWYERTEYSLDEYESREEVRVTWRPDGGTRATPTDATVSCSPDTSPTAAATATAAAAATAAATPTATATAMAAATPTAMAAATPTATATAMAAATPTAAAAVSAADVVADATMSPEDAPEATAPAPESSPPKVFSVLVPIGSKYYDVMSEIRTKLRLEESVRIRLFEVRNFRITRFFHPGDPVSRASLCSVASSLDYGCELRAEPIVHGEAANNASTADAVEVSVVHIAKDNKPRAWKGLTYFGVPIVLMICVDGETVSALRQRIRKRLGVTEDVFATWKLAQVSTHPKVEYLEDLEQVWVPEARHHGGMEMHGLAIEHHGTAPAKKASAASLRFMENHKPLKIAN